MLLLVYVLCERPLLSMLKINNWINNCINNYTVISHWEIIKINHNEWELMELSPCSFTLFKNSHFVTVKLRLGSLHRDKMTGDIWKVKKLTPSSRLFLGLRRLKACWFFFSTLVSLLDLLCLPPNTQDIGTLWLMWIHSILPTSMRTDWLPSPPLLLVSHWSIWSNAGLSLVSVLWPHLHFFIFLQAEH